MEVILALYTKFLVYAVVISTQKKKNHKNDSEVEGNILL